MNNIRYTVLLAALVFTSLQAFSQVQPQLQFFATMHSDEVVPAVNTNGEGLITLLFNNDQTKVNISGMLLHLDGEATAAQLQVGPKGSNGSLLLDISSMIDGRRISGDVDVPPGLIKSLVFNNLYALISTTNHPDGEIRGQLQAETDLNYRCELSGAGVVPATNSSGYGFGGLHFALGADEIDYVFLVSGLSGPVTATEIYEGDPGENGTLIKALPGAFGSTLFGVIDFGAEVLPFIEKCTNGTVYIVLKTAAFPEGEIRGQIRYLGSLNSFAPVNALQQIPSGSSSGFGMNYTVPNANLDSLTTNVYIVGITPVSVNMHLGAPTEVGPVFAEMEPTSRPGLYRKTFALSPAVMKDFVQGRFYLNVTTADHPDGEIRGALRNSLRKGYAFDLCGSKVSPANNSTALGMAMASVDMNNCYIDYRIMVDGFLGGAPVSASIREGIAGQNGIKLYDMPLSNPIISNFHALADGIGAKIEAGETYMEISSPAFPDGEIRGQISRGITCPVLVSGVNNPDWNFEAVVFPNPFSDQLYINCPQVEPGQNLVFQLSDCYGRIVKTQKITQNYTTMETRSISGGLYFWTISLNGIVHQTGKILGK